MSEEVQRDKKSKRALRAGQVIPRGEDTWLIRIFLGRDPASGKRQYHNETFKGKKKAADTKLTKLLHRLQLGEPLKQSGINFTEFVKQWIDVVKLRTRERTYKHYELIVNTYLSPAYSSKRLSDVTSSDINKLYADMLERGLSAKTVRYLHTLLTNIFKTAIRQDLLRRNPMIAVDAPKAVRKEMLYLDGEEMRRFLDAAGKREEGIIFETAFYSGARPSEYLSFKWSDIDWTAKTVTIQRSIVWRRADDWYFSEPKTTKSRRTLPLSDALLAKLSDHRTRQLEARLKAGRNWQANDLVFADEIGNPVPIWTVRHIFKLILKEVGLSGAVRLYDTRHSCATALMTANLNPKVVSERLGHANNG